jgi:Aegerolysin
MEDKMAFRSVRMELFNMTSDTLTKTSEKLDHGEFTNPFQPPQTISPGQLAEWRAESGGVIPIIGSIGTGTEGSVDYEVSGKGDRIRFEWDNPAVGNTFFRFSPPTRADGGPSDFVFFATHIALDESVEPDPVFGAPVVAVTQGDIDDDGVILPLPGQAGIKPHAWFDVGIRNRREPISVRTWLRAVGIPRLGDILIPHFSVRKLIELPF